MVASVVLASSLNWMLVMAGLVPWLVTREYSQGWTRVTVAAGLMDWATSVIPWNGERVSMMVCGE
jgi:hypothetical protein